MANIIIPDGGNIGSSSDTDAITISSTGKVTTADSELNVRAVNGATTHTFTVKGIGESIGDSQSGTAPDTTDSDSGQFAVYNGSTKLFGITEHGYVVKPNVPSFFIHEFNAESAGSFLYAGADVKHNNGNHYSTSTGRFTAPVSGFYFLAGAVLTSASNARVETSIRINDVIYLHGNESTGSSPYGAAHCSGIAELNAGDYVAFKIESGTMHNSHQNNYFSAHLLS